MAHVLLYGPLNVVFTLVYGVMVIKQSGRGAFNLVPLDVLEFLGCDPGL